MVLVWMWKKDHQSWGGLSLSLSSFSARLFNRTSGWPQASASVFWLRTPSTHSFTRGHCLGTGSDLPRMHYSTVQGLNSLRAGPGWQLGKLHCPGLPRTLVSKATSDGGAEADVTWLLEGLIQANFCDPLEWYLGLQVPWTQTWGHLGF